MPARRNNAHAITVCLSLLQCVLQCERVSRHRHSMAAWVRAHRISGGDCCAGEGLTTPVLEQLRAAVRDGCRAQEEALLTAGSPQAARLGSAKAACCAAPPAAVWSDVFQVSVLI